MELNNAYVLLFEGLDAQTTDLYSLVLSARHIDHRIALVADGWSISVRSDHLICAQKEVAAYLKETPDTEIAPFTNRYRNNYSMIWVCLVLIAIHWAAGMGPEKKIIIKDLGALSEGILDGELFRCVTALTLHSNAGHLASNLAALFLLGTWLCRSVGTGIGWLLILGGGSSGNYLNAIVQSGSHLSIGASTAVFSTLGSLCAFSILKQFKHSHSRKKAILPLGGGLALLVLLGANPDTDILAHLFGFTTGLIGAFLWAQTLPLTVSSNIQYLLSIASVAIVASAWTIGFFA